MASPPSPSSPLNPNRSHSSSPHPTLVRRPSQPSSLLRRDSYNNTLPGSDARAVENREDTLDLKSYISPEERLKFFRCLDSDLLPPLASPSQKAKTVEALETVLVLLSNALEKGLSSPTEIRYLQIKLSNPAIRTRLMLDDKDILHGKGSATLDYLHLCGWRPHTKEFQEYYTFPSQPSPRQMADLSTGTEILRTRLEKERQSSAQSVERQRLADEQEAKRREVALMRFKEDRVAKQDRDERERQARESASTSVGVAQTDGGRDVDVEMDMSQS